MTHEKTFSAISKLKDVEMELHRLKNALEMANRALDAQRTWVGLTEEEVDEIYTSVQEEVNKHWDKGGTTMFFPFTLYKALEQALKNKNTRGQE